MIDAHFQKLFSLGLNIWKPWYITSIDLVPREDDPLVQELHVEVDFEKGARFDLDGNEGDLPVQDTRERTWRHLNFFQYRCYITARVPRVIGKDGRVVTTDVPWARAGSGFTLMLEGVILTLVKHMSVSAVAKEIGEHDTRIWRVIGHHVTEALKGQDFSDVTAIGVDEYSHKGHDYVTVFLSHPRFGTDEDGRRVRMKKGRVLFVTEGKDKQTVIRFLEHFIRKSGIPDNVKVCTSDMVHGFRSAMREVFPEAEITVDKFHVVKNIQDAVDKVRCREMRSRDRRKYSVLAKTKYIWLKNPEDLTQNQRSRLDELQELEYLDTVTAYDYRLRLQDFYASHHECDEKLHVDFEELALDMANSSVREIRSFAETLTRNAVEILNYFNTLATNAVLEGFNSQISIVKNRARGFRSMENFIHMIYFVCGELPMPFASIM